MTCKRFENTHSVFNNQKDLFQGKQTSTASYSSVSSRRNWELGKSLPLNISSLLTPVCFAESVTTSLGFICQTAHFWQASGLLLRNFTQNLENALLSNVKQFVLL